MGHKAHEKAHENPPISVGHIMVEAHKKSQSVGLIRCKTLLPRQQS